MGLDDRHTILIVTGGDGGRSRDDGHPVVVVGIFPKTIGGGGVREFEGRVSVCEFHTDVGDNDLGIVHIKAATHTHPDVVLVLVFTAVG